MIQQRLIQLAIVGVVAFCPTVCTAQQPNYDVTVQTAPQTLAVSLRDAESIVYLSSKCEVVAWIYPERFRISDYVPGEGKINKKWSSRGFLFIPDPSNPCPSPGSIVFLPLAFGTGTPDACDPNKLVNSTDLSNTTCTINTALIDTGVVLDDSLEPLVMFRGNFARNSAVGAFVRMRSGITTPAGPWPPSGRWLLRQRDNL